MNEWTPGGIDGTAVGSPLPVVADGDLFATVSPIWSDEDGVRVSIDWQKDPVIGTALSDMSIHQARALADVLTHLADTPPPR